MSFYGNVINYLTKAFKSIKIGTGTIEAENFVDEADLTPLLDTRYNVSISKDTAGDNEDNQLIYTLKQHDEIMGTINIPLDLILEKGQIETKNESGEWGEPGIYLHLVFKSLEGSRDVYINVKDLNEIWWATDEQNDGNIVISWKP